jgi:DNA (cytosine-5)-methyltransferase 1
MGTVIRALEERGYSIAWRVLDAQHFGVAQRRRRVFIVGHLGNDWRTPAEILSNAESSARHSEQSNTKRKETSGIIGAGITDDSRAGNFELYDFPKESVSPTLNARRAHDTMTYQEVARMQGFGDYQIDEIAGSLKARDHKDATDLVIEPEFFYANRQDMRIQGDVINTLSARMGTGGGNTPMVHARQITVIGRKDTSGPQGRGYGNQGDPMFTLDTTSPHAVAYDTYNQNTSKDSQTIKAHSANNENIGTVFQPVAFDTYNQTTNENTTQTIRSGAAGVDHIGAILSKATVRRLTPTECERLQGFPDGWTDEQVDSHRYKQLGNAVAVPVVQWIIDRMVGK